MAASAFMNLTSTFQTKIIGNSSADEYVVDFCIFEEILGILKSTD